MLIWQHNHQNNVKKCKDLRISVYTPTYTLLTKRHMSRFYWRLRLITEFTKSNFRNIFWASWTQSTLCNIYINTKLPAVPKYSKCLLNWGFPFTIFLISYFIPYTLHIQGTSHYLMVVQKVPIVTITCLDLSTPWYKMWKPPINITQMRRYNRKNCF